MYGPSYVPTPGVLEDPTCEAVSQDPSRYTQSMTGKDEFLGLPVVQRMTQFNDGDTYESWQAPELACKEVYTRKSQKDPETGEVAVFETKATKIALGEPNPVWFEIPADYDEKPPSQVREVRYAKNGWKMPKFLKESLPLRDEQYWRSQVYKPVK